MRSAMNEPNPDANQPVSLPGLPARVPAFAKKLSGKALFWNAAMTWLVAFAAMGLFWFFILAFSYPFLKQERLRVREPIDHGGNVGYGDYRAPTWLGENKYDDK